MRTGGNEKLKYLCTLPLTEVGIIGKTRTGAGLFAIYSAQYRPVDSTFILYASDGLDNSKDSPSLINPVTITVRVVWESSYKSPDMYVNNIKANLGAVSSIKYKYWGKTLISNPNVIDQIYTSGDGSYKGSKGYLFCNHYDDDGNYKRYGISLDNSEDGNGGLTSVSMELSSYNTTTDYVYSFDRNANPDSGTTGNYTWTYKRIPFWNAVKDYISTN